MRSWDNFIAIEINKESVSLQQLLRFAKWSTESRFIRNAVDAVLIRQAALATSIEVTDEEVQEAADSFRSVSCTTKRGLTAG
jgi:hypothetical protein